MPRTQLLVTFLTLSSIALGQTPVWFKQFDTTRVPSGVSSDSTGVYFCSSQLRKFTFAGQLLWERPLGDCRAIHADGTAVYVLESRRISSLVFEVFVIRYDRDGNALWQRRLDSTEGFNIPSDLHTGGQGIFATWYSASGPPVVARLDSAGNIVWSRTAGSPQALALGVRFFNGIVYVGGQATLPGVDGPSDLYLRRFDPSGNVLGETFHDNNFRDFFNHMEVNATGVYLAGQSHTAAHVAAGNFLKRLKLDGVPVWSRSYDLPNIPTTILVSIGLAVDKIVIGANTIVAGRALVAILVLDYNGTLESLTRLGPDSPENNVRATHLADRALFLAGMSKGTLPGNPPPPSPHTEREYAARFDLPPVTGPTTLTGVIDSVGLPTGRANSYQNRVGAVCQQLANLADTVRTDLASGAITLAQADPLLLAIESARTAIGCTQ